MTDTTAQPKRRLPWPRLLAWAIVALVLAWLGRGLFPPRLRLVACVPMATHAHAQRLYLADDRLVVVDTQRFDLPEPPDMLLGVRCYTWQGQRQWACHLPRARVEGWTLDGYNSCRAGAVSPDGRIVATIAPAKPGVMALTTWRDGQELGRVHLAARDFGATTNWPFPALLAMDDGRVLVYQDFTMRSPLVLAQGARIVARGTHSISTVTERGYVRLLAPDCRTLVSHTVVPALGNASYSRVAISGSRIVVTPLYTMSLSPMDGVLLPNGLFCDGDGTLYNDTGQLATGHSGSQAILPHPTFSSAVSESDDHGTLRVRNLRTGKSWTLPTGDWVWAVSEDGRFALATRGSETDPLKTFLERFPPLRPLAARIPIRFSLRLYERGYLRAALPLTMGKTEGMYLTERGIRYRIEDYAISETHRRAVLLGIADDGKKPAVLFYRW
jgi:hypothetical protein